MPETEDQRESRELLEALSGEQLAALQEMAARNFTEDPVPDPPDFPRRLLTKLLIDSWTARHGHIFNGACPECGDPVQSIGITKLVYAFDTCRCGEPDYDHLVERIWHAVCFAVDRCPEFVPWPKRGSLAAPDCRRCGRLPESHTNPEGPVDG